MSKTKEKMASEPSYLTKDIDKAAEVAMFYGFMPVKSPRIGKEDIEKAALFRDDKKSSESEYRTEIFPRPEEKVSFLRTYLEWNLPSLEHPVMIYYRRPFAGTLIRKPTNEYHAGFEIIGSLSSICEAMAIKTAWSILSDYGFKDLIVDINSIGDKESLSRLESELASYIRKHIEFVPSELRPFFRKNPFEAITCNEDSWVQKKEYMPKAMSCLSELSISNFKEVLEYLEALEIPYRVTHDLVGRREYCSHTIFEIKDNSSSNADGSNFVFAVGTRHNHLSKKIGFKKDIPIMSVNLRFKKPAVEPKLFFKNKPRPKFYFIQFGSKAKLKSLSVIEALRQARIPLYHSLTRDKFDTQLESAAALGTPFVMIMGQKEALENTVVVRHMLTRVQETVPIQDLANHLSKLR